MLGAYASFAVLDPELTASVPARQVISGAFDTLSHAMETYLGDSDQDNVSDDLALAVMHNTVVNMRRLLKDAEEKFQRFAKEVFGKDTAEEGIQALSDFIQECGLPVKMGDLKSKVEITPEVLYKVADTCNIIKCNPRELSRDEVYEILLECM